jgi:starvation-inducible DNA-binding protein
MSATPHLTRNSLSPKVRQKIAGLLNLQLAALLDLISHCRQAHWNVRGRAFYPLHKLFEELADLLDGHVDDTAERITALGANARGTLRMAAKASPLPDFPEVLDDDIEYVAALMERFAEASADTRKAVDEATTLSDAGTADLLTGLSRDLDKGLWLLEAHRPK